MNTEREIFALIKVDEDVEVRSMETNGLPDCGCGEHFEREFGWLEDSGFCLEDWVIKDGDENEEWQRYLNYLADWIFSHIGEENKGMSPACYDEWKDNDDGEHD